MQDTKKYPVKKIEDLKHVPVSFSVVLDNKQRAIGDYLIECGPLSSKNYTFGALYTSSNSGGRVIDF